MKKKKHHHTAPAAPKKREFWLSVAAGLLYMSTALLTWMIVEGIWNSRFVWPSKLGPGRIIVQAQEPGLYWFAIGFHLVFVVFLGFGARLLWRMAGPTPPPSPPPQRPKRPPNDYPQYRKKKSP